MSDFTKEDSIVYYQQEQWYEVSRYHSDNARMVGIENPDPRPYIMVINSYGKLRKLYTDTGGYEDVV